MNLLSVILNQKATPPQAKQFRAYVSRAKKQLKLDSASARKSSKSPALKNGTALANSSSPLKSVPPPELIPRQSIEAPLKALSKPKIVLRMSNGPKKTSAAAKLPPKITNVVPPRPRSQRSSSDSSLSSLTSLDEDEMDVDSDNDADAQCRTLAQETVQLPPAQTLQANTLSVAQPPNVASLKRSSAEVEIEDREQALTAKKQKLSQAVDREDRSNPSYIRGLSSHLPRAKNDASIPPSESTAGQASGARAGSVEMGSPLTDVSSPLSASGATPPPMVASIKMVKKKAKTKQS